MTKDPAFLFYFRDFLVGTEFMTAEEVGCYIRILCHMADKGNLSEKHMLSICKGYAFTDYLKSKFLTDEDGFFFNKRLSEEVSKRKNYAQSRRENASKESKDTKAYAKAYAKHMGNANIDADANVNEDEKALNPRAKPKKKTFDFEPVWAKYPNKIGKKEAMGHFNITVKTEEDFNNCLKAVHNYIKYLEKNNVESKYIKSGCNWFADWEPWTKYEEPKPASSSKRASDVYVHPTAPSEADQKRVRDMIKATARDMK